MNKTRSACCWLILLLATSFMFACTSLKIRQRESVLDNPQHHYRHGMKFLGNEQLDLAYREFTLAKELDPKFAPAYVGFALLASHRGKFEAAFDNLDKAEDYAKGKGEKVLVQVGKIRVYSEQRGKDWLDEAEDEFKDGREIDPKAPSLYYYIGRAHKLGYEFDKAEQDFKRVLEINSDYIIEANEEWKLVQTIQRAAPGTTIGKEIALIERIDRADVAALFIQELKLDKLLEAKGKKFDTSFKPPSTKKFEAQKMLKAAAATDIANHVLKTDIDIVLKLNIRGLSSYPDHTFRPDERITRANYAVMLEDIIIAISGDKKLATKFIGQTSPFPDLRNDHWAFNAIMTANSRGIMQAKDIVSGEFRSQDVVSGAEALLVIRQFKEKLKF